MPKPAYPAAGTDATADWAKAVTDFAGEKWRYVPVANALLLNNVSGIVAVQNVELTNIPANDPTIVAAHVAAMLQDRSGTAGAIGGAANTVNVLHYDGTQAFVSTGVGVFARGGVTGPSPVLVGGTNNRQIKWNTNVAGTAAAVFLYCAGYWVRDLPT